MNPHFESVEQVIKNYSENALLQLISALQTSPGDSIGTFGCHDNYQYVLQRLISGVLSRQADIKLNCYLGLLAFSRVGLNLNVGPLLQYILRVSDYKKNCDGKPSQIESYVSGRIMIFNSLKDVFINNLEVFASMQKLMDKFPAFEENIIELLFSLIKDKKSKKAFSQLAPKNKISSVLFQLLTHQLNKTQLPLSLNVVKEILEEAVQNFPKRSITVTWLGNALKSATKQSAEWISGLFEAAFQTGQDQEVNVKKINYILQLLEGHLANTTITSENLKSLLNTKIFKYWFTELKVQHKKIRKTAQHIKITFDSDAKLAKNLLVQLHNDNIQLNNISPNHPLYPLYLNAQPVFFLKYLLDQVKKTKENQPSQQTTQEQIKNYWGELQFFIVTRLKDISRQTAAQTISLFINRYHQAKTQSNLQSVTTIFNAILHPQSKKKIQLQDKAYQILSAIPFEDLQLSQNGVLIEKAIRMIKTRFENQQEKSTFVICLSNFIVAVGYYCLLYPQQVQIFDEWKPLQQDLTQRVQGIDKPKKKRKLNEQQDPNMPIHVLVDIFISLLTKSPAFLRTAVNQLFEQIVPYMDGEDVSHLLQVLQRPDQQYMQDTQKQQQKQQ